MGSTSHEVHVPMSIAHGMCRDSMAPLLTRIEELEAALAVATRWIETECVPDGQSGHTFCMSSEDHEAVRAVLDQCRAAQP